MLKINIKLKLKWQIVNYEINFTNRNLQTAPILIKLIYVEITTKHGMQL